MIRKFIYIMLYCVVACLMDSCNSPKTIYVGGENLIDNSLNNQLTSENLTLDAKNFLITNCIYRNFKANPKGTLAKCIRQIDTLENRDNESMIIGRNSRKTIKIIIELAIYLAKKESILKRSIFYWGTVAYYSYRYLSKQYITSDIESNNTAIIMLYYNYAVYKIFTYLLGSKQLLKGNCIIDIVNRSIKFNKPIGDLPWPIDSFNSFFNCFAISKPSLNEDVFVKGLGIPLGCIPAKNNRFPKLLPLVRIVKYLYPATFIIKFELDQNKKDVIATPIFYNYFKDEIIKLNTKNFTLSSDYSSIIAKFLEKYPLSTESNYFFDPGRMISDKIMGVYFLEPYSSKKIPILFIHGFISNPQSMYQIVNTLMQYEFIKNRYQLWFYFYPTGQPIIITSYILREILNRIDVKYNKCNRNSKFNKMVVIGYSLGGLVAKLLIQDSKGDYFENLILKNKNKKQSFVNKHKYKNMIYKLLHFNPLSYVNKMIFISTPHKGAKMADWLGAEILADLTRAPQDYYKDYKETFLYLSQISRKQNNDIITGNALNNLRPESNFIRIVQKLPYSKKVKIYSIIGDENMAGRVGGNDGVTSYNSTHLNAVVRETVIKSDHHSIYKPACAKEILRILLGK